VTGTISGSADHPIRPICRARLAPWQVRLATAEMQGQFRGRLRIGDVAAKLKLSTAHFTKAFHNTVGISPYGWFQRARIAHAMGLMRDTALTLAQIASECGYTDESHFSERFDRFVGVRPGRWRRDDMVHHAARTPRMSAG
jgi:AraC-like DNA-binding protein